MARIGLLSDSHGRAATTRRAVALLLDHGAERLIHLGDFTGPAGGAAVLDALLVAAPEGGTVPVHVVFGNVDDPDELAPYARAVGLHVDHPSGLMKLGGRLLAYQHGHDDRALRQALEARVDYLCHGHTHQARDQRQGPTRIINPGALHRAAGYSVALLDTQSDRLTFHAVPNRG